MSQPAGTLVCTPAGMVAIETLIDGDRVMSYDNDSTAIVRMLSGLQTHLFGPCYQSNLRNFLMVRIRPLAPLKALAKVTQNSDFPLIFQGIRGRVMVPSAALEKG